MPGPDRSPIVEKAILFHRHVLQVLYATDLGQELDHGVPPESEKSHSSRIKSPEVIVMK